MTVMDYRSLFVNKKDDFEKIWALIENAIDVKKELPNQIFNTLFRDYALEEFDWALTSDFWSTLQKLTTLSGDSEVYMGILDSGSKNYFLNNFGYYNIASLPMSMTKYGYADFLRETVQIPPIPIHYSLLFSTEIVVWFPPSLKWFLWGERAYTILILAFADEGLKKAAASFTNAWIQMDDMLDIMSLNFKNDVIPKEFEEKFRENYGNEK